MKPVPTAQLLDGLSVHGRGFVDATARAAAGAAVPACPGWGVADLGWHLGVIWERFGRAVAEGWAEQADFAAYEPPTRPADDDLPRWLGERLLDTVDALTAADPGTTVWNWTGAEQHARWVLRRLTHETLVHRLDVDQVLGDVPPVAPTLAADGVDEFFPSYHVRGGGGPLDGVVALLADDVEAAWWLAPGGDGLVVASEPVPVVATVRGPALDLLRWVWRRPATVRVLGDEAVARQLQAFSHAS